MAARDPRTAHPGLSRDRWLKRAAQKRRRFERHVHQSRVLVEHGPGFAGGIRVMQRSRHAFSQVTSSRPVPARVRRHVAPDGKHGQRRTRKVPARRRSHHPRPRRDVARPLAAGCDAQACARQGVIPTSARRHAQAARQIGSARLFLSGAPLTNLIALLHFDGVVLRAGHQNPVECCEGKVRPTPFGYGPSKGGTGNAESP